jgi:hypothetical protein
MEEAVKAGSFLFNQKVTQYNRKCKGGNMGLLIVSMLIIAVAGFFLFRVIMKGEK